MVVIELKLHPGSIMDNDPGYDTFSNQVTDQTICSEDSNYASLNNSSNSRAPEQETKIKAYVDFTEFNKNYEEYLKRKGLQEMSDGSLKPIKK